jgi:uncharacterized protein YdaU (DUF1376 family)
MNYYAFHIGDYSKDTRHLSWDEDMAYRRMIDAYYTREAPLPREKAKIYRIICATSEPQRDAVDIVLEEFFVLADDGYRQARCDQVIEDSKEAAVESDSRKENEKERQKRHRDERKKLFSTLRDKGVVPAFDAPTSTLRELVVTHTGHTPITSYDTVTTHNSNVIATSDKQQTRRLPNPNPNPNPNININKTDSVFEEFWAACPRQSSQGNARTAWEVAIGKAAPDVIISAMKAFAAKTKATKTEDKFIPFPATWLDDERWLDGDLQPAQAMANAKTVFVTEGSPQWKAWLTATGRTRFPTCEGKISENSQWQRGWRFATEWPEGYPAEHRPTETPVVVDTKPAPEPVAVAIINTPSAAPEAFDLTIPDFLKRDKAAAA